MTNKHIEIVCSTQARLSSMSQRSRAAILAVLAKHYANVGITIVNNLADLEALSARQPDLVFLGMKFIPEHPHLGADDPEKIWISDYLDEHDITYTGSSQMAHELELSKPLAKRRVLGAGLKTSPFYVARQNQQLSKGDILLTYPLFIKPANRGGGVGIDSDSVAHNFDELQAKVRSITANLQSDSLIEEYLPGREFSLAILKDEYSAELQTMPIELVAEPDQHGVCLLSGDLKSSNAEQVLEVTDETIKFKICTLALDVFHALGARDYGRIDIRLDAAGTPHFLEANLLPSLIGGYGSFPKACVINKNLAYEPMILSIVRLALARSTIEDLAAPVFKGTANILSSLAPILEVI